MPDGDAPCTCGDVFDEHGGDPEYPGSTACNACDECIAFEEEHPDEAP